VGTSSAYDNNTLLLAAIIKIIKKWVAQGLSNKKY
jgi:hypothetical protein